ncbi:ribosomal protein S18-alanine N-acetyltransferase [Alloacidobacterium sp.]|uniref:ribosomal protein S18-alanine N-acetyltransferase n=1 Tax=Alloacidobacterium sp. TaxID=2951999 RepID=UPI002D229CAD|nr:ribosomal protein S18-alanine N-acetyltransferase [Alloacidobacterium sp.]HYK36166.1 ribosomal protein S18-alanine N-acetyltransferase [Alloacidobacterium sp.]
MSCTIRRIAAGDIEAVFALAEEIPGAPRWSPDDYSRCISDNESGLLRRAGFIAETDGHLLGFSIGKLVAEVCELESIAVSTEARGQGIGRALFEEVIGWAQSNEAIRIELEVRASNTGAIKLYEQFGLSREGLRPTYYHSPEEDAVLMGKNLKPVENFS